MRRRFLIGIGCLIASFLLGQTTGARSGDLLEAGLSAIRRAAAENALEIWGPLAERRDQVAQFGLGLLYLKGDGVI